MKYTLRPDVVLATVLDESMLVAIGNNPNCIENMQGVNETGAYYWKLLEKGMEIDDIVASAMRDYEITEEIARPSFMQYLETLRDAGFLTLED